MAATIFSAPKHIKMPPFSEYTKTGRYDREAHNNAEQKYLDELKEFLVQRNKGEYVGETIQFPVANGYAQYMVASLKPVQLVHLDLGDAWEFAQIHLMTAKAVKEHIERAKAFAAIWKKAK